ncbi:MAG: DUF3866 family protein [Acidimicrobiia bacterium]
MAFREATVTEIISERQGLQRVYLDDGTRAYVLEHLIGRVAPHDRVIVNTTAVELDLGTGGWHVVLWNQSRTSWSEPGPGHIMKLRYTPLQLDAGSAEEHLPDLPLDLEGRPVVAALLHSQIAAIAVAIKDVRPSARIANVMTDEAPLPLALSHLVATLIERRLIDATVTAGQAFGGMWEAVSIPSALTVAAHAAEADIVIVAMGPGIVGTGSTLGFSGAELGSVLDWTNSLHGRPVAALRTSFADSRERHRGLSHHCKTAFGLAMHTRAQLVVPTVGGSEEAEIRADLDATGLATQHEILSHPPVGIVERFADLNLHVTSMGRSAAEDEVFFEAAAVAGAYAATSIQEHGKS